MFRRSNTTDPQGASLDFSLFELKGSWESHEGAPAIRIYRNAERKDGCYYLELTYGEGVVYQLPIKKYWGDVRYFDLYGFVGLAYDAERDVLQLSSFGDYYRSQV